MKNLESRFLASHGDLLSLAPVLPYIFLRLPVGTKFFVRGHSLKNKFSPISPGGQWQYYFFQGVVASLGILKKKISFFSSFWDFRTCNIFSACF